MSATAEKIIHEVNFGEKIKVVLTELLFPSSAFLGKGNFIVHYLEKDEEPLSINTAMQIKHWKTSIFFPKSQKKSSNNTQGKKYVSEAKNTLLGHISPSCNPD